MLQRRGRARGLTAAFKAQGTYRDWASLPKKVLKAMVAAVQDEQDREYRFRQRVPNHYAFTQKLPMPGDGLLIWALTCRGWREFQQSLGPLRTKVGDLLVPRSRWLGRLSPAVELKIEGGAANHPRMNTFLLTWGLSHGMPVRGPRLPTMPETLMDLSAAGSFGEAVSVHMQPRREGRLTAWKKVNMFVKQLGPQVSPNVRVDGATLVHK